METLEEVLWSKAAGAEQRRAILSFVQGKDVFVSLSGIDFPLPQATLGGN